MITLSGVLTCLLVGADLVWREKNMRGVFVGIRRQRYTDCIVRGLRIVKMLFGRWRAHGAVLAQRARLPVTIEMKKRLPKNITDVFFPQLAVFLVSRSTTHANRETLLLGCYLDVKFTGETMTRGHLT